MRRTFSSRLNDTKQRLPPRLGPQPLERLERVVPVGLNHGQASEELHLVLHQKSDRQSQ